MLVYKLQSLFLPVINIIEESLWTSWFCPLLRCCLKILMMAFFFYFDHVLTYFAMMIFPINSSFIEKREFFKDNWDPKSQNVYTLHYRIVVQCTLIFLGPKSSPDVLIRYRTFIIFGEKIHPVWLLNTMCLLNLDFFLNFFLDFSTKTSGIFFFLCQFYQFSPFGHRNPKNTLFD